MKKNNQGFTLIELMIVVAIIAIIAAIAIPNLLRSRMAANEASAAGSMRTISTSEVSFQTAGFVELQPGVGAYGTLVELHEPPQSTATGFIDEVLAAGLKQGYNFEVVPGDDLGAPIYTATAEPSVVGRTGERHFFVDESGVIRVNIGAAATADSPPMN